MVSQVPGFCQLGLASAMKSGYTVNLWTYGKLVGIPHGFGELVIRDASALIRLKKAKELLSRGMAIQHLSDWVRLLAIKHHHSLSGFASGAYSAYSTLL